MPEVSKETSPGGLEVPDDTDRYLHAALRDAMRLQVLRRMRGTVHHDFVSPLQATTLTLDLLRRQLQQPRTDEELERTLHLIEGGKAELARFRAGVANVLDTLGATERKRHFDLGQTVEQLSAWMQNEAAFLGLQLELQRPEQQLSVDASPEDVRQVLAILMLCAIDSLSSGGRLRIGVRADGRYAQVNLVAEGLKEPARWSPRIFEPNWAEPRTLLGLGPYVARSSAANFGGEISIETISARNAAVHLRLPLAS
jgi:C4-dicarboxylate-specific signal transduction histidine kinase